ncbi:hypothetical protein [Budvicia aquatica]|uniref:hypothetical protein n=1 Tax=Budvicia aquatica TaxID=82979 RepID=UPI0021C39D54|nr:hypothetical protein [Budvicia aquatica]
MTEVIHKGKALSIICMSLSSGDAMCKCMVHTLVGNDQALYDVTNLSIASGRTDW